MPETADMAQSAHACLQVVLDNLIGRDHPTAQVMEAVILALTERETELE